MECIASYPLVSFAAIIRAVKETTDKPSIKGPPSGISNWRWPLNRCFLRVGPKCGRNWPRGQDLSLYYKLLFNNNDAKYDKSILILWGVHAETKNFTVLIMPISFNIKRKCSYGRLWFDCKQSLIFLWNVNARESPKHASRNKWGHKPEEKESTASSLSGIWACVIFCLMSCQRNWTCFAYHWDCLTEVNYNKISRLWYPNGDRACLIEMTVKLRSNVQ